MKQIQIKISKLVEDTVFYYGDVQYRLDKTHSWRTPYCGKCLGVAGTEENRIIVYRCAPYYGGKYQTELMEWISGETLVTVENNAILNKAKAIINNRKKDTAFNEKCVEAGICPKCGEDLIKLADIYYCSYNSEHFNS